MDPNSPNVVGFRRLGVQGIGLSLPKLGCVDRFGGSRDDHKLGCTNKLKPKTQHLYNPAVEPEWLPNTTSSKDPSRSL